MYDMACMTTVCRTNMDATNEMEISEMESFPLCSMDII